MDTELLEELSSQDWESLFPQLTYFASLLVHRNSWRNGTIDLPKGFQVKDLVHEAVSSVFNGERHWNPAQVDILSFLKGVIRSKINHLVNSSEHKNHSRLDTSSPLGESLLVDSTSTVPLPEAKLVAKDTLKFLWKLTIDDNNMRSVLLCLSQGMKRKEIISKLSLSPGTIDRILKKIRVALLQYNGNQDS